MSIDLSIVLGDSERELLELSERQQSGMFLFYELFNKMCV